MAPTVTSTPATQPAAGPSPKTEGRGLLETAATVRDALEAWHERFDWQSKACVPTDAPLPVEPHKADGDAKLTQLQIIENKLIDEMHQKAEKGSVSPPAPGQSSASRAPYLAPDTSLKSDTKPVAGTDGKPTDGAAKP